MQKTQSILDSVDWSPERCFVIDVDYFDQTEEVKIIELNAISTSGWYTANPEPIVRELSRVALEEWKDIYEI